MAKIGHTSFSDEALENLQALSLEEAIEKHPEIRPEVLEIALGKKKKVEKPSKSQSKKSK